LLGGRYNDSSLRRVLRDESSARDFGGEGVADVFGRRKRSKSTANHNVPRLPDRKEKSTGDCECVVVVFLFFSNQITQKTKKKGFVATTSCVTAFRNGETHIECTGSSKRCHRLALRDIAPDLGVKFTPVITANIEYVLSSVAGQGELRGRLGKKVVAVTNLDMEKAVRYGHSDPWQLLYRLCHVRHPNILSLLGILQVKKQHKNKKRKFNTQFFVSVSDARCDMCRSKKKYMFLVFFVSFGGFRGRLIWRR
jgi:hypothetical protein